MRPVSSIILLVCAALLGAVVAAPASAAEPAPADEPPPGEEQAEELLLAPFACGTEWQGTTYEGHGRTT